MPRYFAFLRAINVGGHVVRMEDLRGHFSALGFSGVETFIASGNVIFQGKSSKAGDLEKKIEKHLATTLGYPVATFLRTDAELAAIAACRPFDEAAVSVSVTNCVGFLAQPLDAEQHETLMGMKTDNDTFHHNGREVYWISRVGQGESKISNGLLERKLKTSITFRNVNTVAKLLAKYR
jgi:uncharacterized protein (DUF1697 family)